MSELLLERLHGCLVVVHPGLALAGRLPGCRRMLRRLPRLLLKRLAMLGQLAHLGGNLSRLPLLFIHIGVHNLDRATQTHHRIVQGIHRLGYRHHGAANLVGKGVEGVGQLAEVIGRANRQTPGQVTVALRHITQRQPQPIQSATERTAHQ